MQLIVDAVVINLARRPDRLARFLSGWGRAAPGRAVRVQEAVDTGTPEGCRLSHLAALESATGPVLVMEDDAVFADDFTLDHLPDPPEDWQVLRLGGQEMGTYIPAREGFWVQPIRMVRTHAYIVRDPAMFAAHVRFGMREMRYMADLPFPQYALARHTVGQAAGTSDIDSHVRDVDQYWNRAASEEFTG